MMLYSQKIAKISRQKMAKNLVYIYGQGRATNAN